MSDGELTNRIHPKSHIGELRGLLPQKYSPLRANGDGLQSVYLAEVGRPFAAALFRLIGGEANQVADVAKEVVTDPRPSREPDLERWEKSVARRPRIARAFLRRRGGIPRGDGDCRPCIIDA